MLIILAATCFTVLVIAFAGRLLKIDRRERGEDEDGWGGGGRGPDDWPKLPRPPSGGPIDSGDFKLWALEMETVTPRKIEIPVKKEEEEP